VGDVTAVLRGRVAVVLGQIGPMSAEAIRALTEALSDVNEDVRLLAIIALVEAGQAAVEAALHSADHKVRERAVAALIEVGLKTDGKKQLPSDGWLIWENETHIIIRESATEPKVYRKRPGKWWDDRWHKDFFQWRFKYDRDGMPICVHRSRCSPD
jgi:hypothetical protein